MSGTWWGCCTMILQKHSYSLSLPLGKWSTQGFCSVLSRRCQQASLCSQLTSGVYSSLPLNPHHANSVPLYTTVNFALSCYPCLSAILPPCPVILECICGLQTQQTADEKQAPVSCFQNGTQTSKAVLFRGVRIHGQGGQGRSTRLFEFYRFGDSLLLHLLPFLDQERSTQGGTGRVHLERSCLRLSIYK